MKSSPVFRKKKPPKARLELDELDAAFFASILSHSLGSVEQDIAAEDMLKFSKFVQRLCGTVEALLERSELGGSSTGLARRTTEYKKVRKLFDPDYEGSDE